MKKLMRIALVFALAGATLVGCTKDYSGDISDLNKKVSEQQSAVTALQTAVSNAQTAADNALANAQNALKEAQAAAKAAADANNNEEVAALTAKVATIEGEIADLEAKVKALDGLEAKLNEVAEQLKKDVDAKVDAALEELRAELDKALAQIDGAFSIKGIDPYSNTCVEYYWSEWNPGTVKAEKERFAKLAKAFPELAEIEKGEVIDYNTGVPFIVTPSTLEFDETDTFTLVDFYGQDFGFTLGDPVASPFNVKAGTAGVWFVDVLAPAYDKYGDIKQGYQDDLALVVERANGAVAQTSFEYEVYSEKIDKSASFSIGINPEFDEYGHFVRYSNNILVRADKFENGVYDIAKYIYDADSPLYGEYFVIEPTNVLQVEKYGVSVDGSEITILNRPEAGESAITVGFMITAIGMNGKTAAAAFTLTVTPEAIAPNAELADKTVTLGWANNSYNVNVDYAVEDFGFTPLEWDTVFNALKAAQTGDDSHPTLSAYFVKDGNHVFDDADKLGTSGYISFLKANKQSAGVSTDAKYIRFTVQSDDAIPGEYSVMITDGAVFCAVGNVTVVNPEASAIKLVPALCKDGVLQIVGASDGSVITYDLNKALVYKSEEATNLKFTDVAFKEAHDYDPSQTQEKNWLNGNAGTFEIGVQTSDNKQLYTAREFEVEYYRFGNVVNKCKFNFTAEAISPIYSAEGASLEITDASIFFEPTTPISFDNQVELNKIIGKGTYVAGTSTSQKFNILKTYTGKADTKTYTYDPTKNKSDYVAAQFDAKEPEFHGEATTQGAEEAWNSIPGANEYKLYTLPSPSKLSSFINAMQTVRKINRVGYFWVNKEGYLPQTTPNAWIKDNAGEFIIIDKSVSNVLRGFGLTDAEIVSVQQSTKPLYLTEAMVNLAFTAWQKYYNADGTKINPAGTIAEGDKNAVAAYESIKESFLVVTKHPNNYDVTPRSTDVAKVTVKFDDKLVAAKFIENAEGFVDPYESSLSEKIYAKSDYDIADLEGKTSVDVTGTVEVKDAWGMTTKKAFKVTCKINPAK